MLYVSTPQTAEQGKPTALSIFETILAIGLMLFLIEKNNNINLLLFPVLLAPFLLLRTNISTDKGINLAHKLYEKMKNKEKKSILFELFSMPPLYVGFFIFIKVYSIISTLIKHPIKSFLSIPENLWRITMCTDSFHPPELVPGIELKRNQFDSHKMFLFNDFIETFKIQHRVYKYDYGILNTIVYMFILILLIPMFVLSFLLSFSYRLSLKSTSIIYLPLVWVLTPAINNNISIKEKIRVFITSDIAKITFWTSFFILLLFISKVILIILIKNSDIANIFSYAPVLHPLIEPMILPIWQIASFINSLIFISLMFFLRSKMNEGIDSSNRSILPLMSLSLVLRRALSIYTITCTIYILFTTLSNMDLPKLGQKIVPW